MRRLRAAADRLAIAGAVAMAAAALWVASRWGGVRMRDDARDPAPSLVRRGVYLGPTAREVIESDGVSPPGTIDE